MWSLDSAKYFRRFYVKACTAAPPAVIEDQAKWDVTRVKRELKKITTSPLREAS